MDDSHTSDSSTQSEGVLGSSPANDNLSGDPYGYKLMNIFLEISTFLLYSL